VVWGVWRWWGVLTSDAVSRFEARQAKVDAAAEKKRGLKAASTLESMKSQEELFGPSIALPTSEEAERS
jgi:hypothetical protein